jgi:hypothetical protein
MMNKLKHTLSVAKFIVDNIGRLGTLKKYADSNFNSPPPVYIKQKFLSEQDCSVWIETGTYKGETTKVLATVADHVTTIEAQEFFYSTNIITLSKIKNVTALFGSSDILLKAAIQEYVNAGFLNINFFLDAHYSGGETYGLTSNSPIIGELDVIEKFLPKLKAVSVFIDDFRLFKAQDHEDTRYPDRNYLVSFAQKNNLSWDVSHDFFILSKH